MFFLCVHVRSFFSAFEFPQNLISFDFSLEATPENLNEMFHLLTNLFVCLLCCCCTHTHHFIDIPIVNQILNFEMWNLCEWKLKKSQFYLSIYCLWICTNKKFLIILIMMRKIKAMKWWHWSIRTQNIPLVTELLFTIILYLLL